MFNKNNARINVKLTPNENNVMSSSKITIDIIVENKNENKACRCNTVTTKATNRNVNFTVYSNIVVVFEICHHNPKDHLND